MPDQIISRGYIHTFLMLLSSWRECCTMVGNKQAKQATALIFILAVRISFWSIDSCFTVWDSQLRPLTLTPGKNQAYIPVFPMGNRETLLHISIVFVHLMASESICALSPVMLPASKTHKLSLCLSRSSGYCKKRDGLWYVYSKTYRKSVLKCIHVNW